MLKVLPAIAAAMFAASMLAGSAHAAGFSGIGSSTNWGSSTWQSYPPPAPSYYWHKPARHGHWSRDRNVER